MSVPLYVQPDHRSANVPNTHKLIEDSFVFLPSTGARVAPEILLLESMREIFFKTRYDKRYAKDLDANETDGDGNYVLNPRERVVLHALRGRRKKYKTSRVVETFFAPCYPHLASYGWLRPSSDRVVKDFLFAGPLGQHLICDCHGTTGDLEQQVYEALLGLHQKKIDILAATLGIERFEKYSGEEHAEAAKKKIKEMIMAPSGRVIRGLKNDEISQRITRDLESICSLASFLPRMQWLQVYMTFLRFALPMWVLSHMQITRLLHGWLLDATSEDAGDLVGADKIRERLATRNRNLLHLTMTPTRELFEHIERYMQCRVELDILLYSLEEVCGDEIRGKVLTLESGKSSEISIEKLLMTARDNAPKIRKLDRFKEVANNLDIKTFLIREGALFPAWLNPIVKGQGKNIDEFFRVLYRADLGDEAGGHLLVREEKGRGFRVYPGQLLLKTVTYLAAQDKKSSMGGRGGMLVLQDVEDHFAQYGVDFSTAATARQILTETLTDTGLLTGSPDAGSSVSIANPYECPSL